MLLLLLEYVHIYNYLHLRNFIKYYYLQCYSPQSTSHHTTCKPPHVFNCIYRPPYLHCIPMK